MTHSPDHAKRAREVLAEQFGQNADRLVAIEVAMLAYADERVAAALGGQTPAAEGATHSPSITGEDRQAGIDHWIAPSGVRGRDRVVWDTDLSAAPYNEVVRVKVGDMTFFATLLPDHSMSDEETACDQWSAVKEGEHPPCWSAGLCWSSNEDGVMSLQPEAWAALDDTVRIATTEKEA